MSIQLFSFQRTRAILLDCNGGKRDRTADLLRAKQALSQLSYTPVKVIHSNVHKYYYSIDENKYKTRSLKTK